MPITVQEVVLTNQWDRKERRIELGEARWVENYLAKTGHEGENEKEYWLEQRKLGGEEHEWRMNCKKYVALKIQVIGINKWKLIEERWGDCV